MIIIEHNRNRKYCVDKKGKPARVAFRKEYSSHVVIRTEILVTTHARRRVEDMITFF